MFGEERAEIAKQTRLLHSTHEESQTDWRRAPRHVRQGSEQDSGMLAARVDFSRFFSSDWKNVQVSANLAKVCPAKGCQRLQPLHQFYSNPNTADKLDVYCMQCNQKRRNTRTVKTGGRVFFNQQSPTKKCEEDPVAREVDKRIKDAAEIAHRRYGRHFKVDKEEIYRRLFKRNHVFCYVTGDALTPLCFLEHHTVTFSLSENSKNIDVICSQSKIGPLKPIIVSSS